MAIQNFSPLQLNGTLSVGVNDAGHDVVFYGNTANKRVLWDTSVDHLKLYDDTKIVFGTGAAEADYDGSIYWDQTDLVIDSESDLQILSNAIVTGSLAVTSDASLGSAAMTLTNADVDQIALDINASNTTGNIIDINAQALTTGSAIYIDCNSLDDTAALHIDVDDAQTTTSWKILNYIDYDKISNTPNTIANSVTGSAVYLNDNATSNHAGSTHVLTGHDSKIGFANTNGTQVVSGHSSIITTGSTLTAPNGIRSYFSGIANGYGVDFQSVSSANSADYFSIETTTNGATTLTTVDADAALAHFEIAADGNITLDAAGSVIVGTDNMSVESGEANDPVLQIKNTANDDTSGRLQFNTNRGAAGQALDSIGRILFYGQDDGAPSSMLYGEIETTIHDATNNEESGNMAFKVAADDGGLEDGLVITGGSVDAEVDVTIANGAASLTTVAGTLTMGSTATLNNTGQIQVASQPSITTLAGLTSLGSAGATTDIAAGDLTVYNAVNNGNPTISLGSSATNRFVIESAYNSSAQTIDHVNFTTFTTSGSTNDGRYFFYVDEVEIVRFLDYGAFFIGKLQTSGDGAMLQASDTQASSATTGGRLDLETNDGAAMGDDHRLGVINFNGAEDASSTLTTGASIEAFCEAGWSASENGARMVFSTTDGDASTSTVLTLDSDKLATFTGAVTSTGTLTTGGTIELGDASDTTIARSAAGVATIEGNQIVTAGVPKGNTFHIGCPTYISLYLFYMNIQNYWYTPPMYNTQVSTNTAIGSMGNFASSTQARAANYVAPRACKVKTVAMVFKQASSYLSGDINLEFQLIKWTPDDDGAASVAVTDMAITDHAGGFTEGDVHSLIFTVTDNADAALAANDCLAFCVRTTSAPGSGSTVRNLVNGHINYEIEIT